jgi:TonB family protein
MKFLLTISLWVFSLVPYAQSVTQIQININEDLKILSDVTANADSIPNGRYLIIYKNKTLVKGFTKDGLLDGIWTLYYTNGQQKMKARYSGGTPHGEWILWSVRGDVQAKFQYNHGKQIGHWQGYYYDHSKAIDIIYNPSGNPVQCIQYYDEEEIIALNHEYTYTGKLSKADLSYYFKNYNLFHFEQWRNNKLNGIYANYHSNGVVWESFKYENGKLLQVTESRSEGGMPRKNEYFRDGNGVLHRYYANGNLFSKTYYKNGLKQDTVTIYGQTGKVADRGFYDKGEPVGSWSATGFQKIIFESNPSLTYGIKRISPAQKEREEGSFIYGYRHGTWKKYDSYGDLIGEINYSYGLLDGVAKSYQNTKVMEELHFSNGNKKGDFTYFSSFGEINSKETFVAESFLDTNWFKVPEDNWIQVENMESHAHQIHMRFYANFPGMELVSSDKDPRDKQEMLFATKRKLGYRYWPELIPAQMTGGLYAEKEYIRKHLIIPETALDKNMEGSVMLRYKVDELGLISEVVILKSLGFGLDEAAVNIIKSFPPLNSATYNGIPIPSYVVREIDFRL